MPRLTTDQLLAPPTLKECEVSIPELGGDVLVREFTKAQIQQLRADATLKYNTKAGKAGEIDQNHLELLMVVHGVVEPKLEPQHVAQMRQLPNGIIDRIVKAIFALNGLGAEAQQAADATFQDEARAGE